MSESTEEINGRISAMRDFADQLRPPDFGQVRSDAQGSVGGGGGMAEGAKFNQAHAAAVAKVEQFTTQVEQGFQAYTELAAGASDTYRTKDQASAASMPKTG